jgi:exodeoxyribonuclease V alpha subunit
MASLSANRKTAAGKRSRIVFPKFTGAKRLVVLVGQKKAVAIAVRNVSGRRRWSKLAEWLRRGLAD